MREPVKRLPLSFLPADLTVKQFLAGESFFAGACRIFFHSCARCGNRIIGPDVTPVLAACSKRRAIIARRSSTKFLVVF